MYMNVIRNVICTLIILPIGLQAETSHSSMAKDTITVVATGNQNTVFETPSMVSVVTNDTPWSQNAVTSAGMLKGVAGLSQTGAGRTNGQTFNLRGYDKSGVLVLVDGIRQLSDMAKSSGTYLIRHSSNVSKLSADQTPVCTAVAGWEVLWTSELPMQQISFPRRDKRFKSVGKYRQW